MSTSIASKIDRVTARFARSWRSLPFALRLFAVVLGVGGVGILWQSLRICQQHLAIQRIERAGGFVQRAAGRSPIARIVNGTRLAPLFEGVHEVLLSGMEISAQRVADLKHLGDIENLALLHTRVPESVFIYLHEPRQLRLLSLESTDVTDTLLALVRKSASLQTLNLAHTAITDDGLAHLATALPNLEVLNLTGTRVTDSGLSRLKPMKMLRRIYLDDTSVTEEGLAALQRELPGLNAAE